MHSVGKNLLQPIGVHYQGDGILFCAQILVIVKTYTKHTNFQSLSPASVFEEDIQGQISLLVVHDSVVSCAVMGVSFVEEME